MSLYEALGVEKDASPQEIRQAYRKVAKRAHPDRGGSREEWDKVSRALTLLTDPVARERYDATGEEDWTSPDRSRADAMNFLRSQFEGIVDQVEDPGEIDMAATMQAAVDLNREEPEIQIRKAEKWLRKSAKFRGKAKRKEKGENIFEFALDARDRDAREAIEVAKERLRVLDVAETILLEYEFAPRDAPRYVDPFTVSLPGSSFFDRL